MTREGESLQGEVLITLRVNITVDLWGVAAALDVDQERCVLHRPLLATGLVSFGVNLKQSLKCCLQLTLRAGKKFEQKFLLVTFCHRNYFVRCQSDIWTGSEDSLADGDIILSSQLVFSHPRDK